KERRLREPRVHPLDRNVVVSGVNGNMFFLQLDFSCSTAAVSNCIYQNMDYRVRVNGGPFHGHFRVEDTPLEIVS
ncbi:hypothetical protein BGZ52_001920, partial [Haplosporangium bisporale]